MTDLQKIFDSVPLRILYLLDLFDDIPEEKEFFGLSIYLAQILCNNIEEIFVTIEFSNDVVDEVQDYAIEMKKPLRLCLNTYKMLTFFLIDAPLGMDSARASAIENKKARLVTFTNNMAYLKENSKSLDQNILNTYIGQANRYITIIDRKIT
jgi:hypothetical protein